MPLNELGNAHARNTADPFDNMGWTPAGKIGETIIIGGELFVHYRLRSGRRSLIFISSRIFHTSKTFFTDDEGVW